MNRIKRVSYGYASHPNRNYSNVSPEFVQKLQGAINGEASAIRFYGDLLTKLQEDKTAYDNVKSAFDDENKHFRALTKLYVQLTGKQPQIKINPVHYSSLEDAYLKAFFDELEASELYSDMYLMTRDPNIRDIFYMAHNDESEHAQRYSFLYNREKRK